MFRRARQRLPVKYRVCLVAGLMETIKPRRIEYAGIAEVPGQLRERAIRLTLDACRLDGTAAAAPTVARRRRVKDCLLPESGWGELDLLGSTPDAGGAWTDSGQADEDRQLKHRDVSDTRPVPAPPGLVKILHQHIATFPTSPDGRLFVTRVGRAGVPLPPPFNKPLRMGTAY